MKFKVVVYQVCSMVEINVKARDNAEARRKAILAVQSGKGRLKFPDTGTVSIATEVEEERIIRPN